MDETTTETEFDTAAAALSGALAKLINPQIVYGAGDWSPGPEPTSKLEEAFPRAVTADGSLVAVLVAKNVAIRSSVESDSFVSVSVWSEEINRIFNVWIRSDRAALLAEALNQLARYYAR